MTDLSTNLGTEAVDPRFAHLDILDVDSLVRLMNDADAELPALIATALPQVSAAIEAISARFLAGGRIVYVGAGTSGRLGVLDASECPPTYNVPAERVVGIVAGGDAALRDAVEGAEDDADVGAAAVDGISLTAADAVVGIASSGRTPYVLGALRRAGEIGALTVALSCNADSATSKVADLAIEIPIPAEVVAGSTRLRSGTAQKLVLNMISTITMIRAGKVFGNRMVDLRASNVKLEIRAARMVAELAEVDQAKARVALVANGWSVKQSVAQLLLGVSPEEAAARLEAHGGRLRDTLALPRLGSPDSTG